APDMHTLDYGIFVIGNATLDLSEAAVNNIYPGSSFNGPLSGCQTGVAIRAGSKHYGQVAHATIENVTVNLYAKGGIVIDGPGSTGDVEVDQVTDQPENIVASNGIQISRGATATVENDIVRGNECNYA